MHFLPHEHGLYLAFCDIPILTLPILLRDGERGVTFEAFWAD